MVLSRAQYIKFKMTERLLFSQAVRIWAHIIDKDIPLYPSAEQVKSFQYAYDDANRFLCRAGLVHSETKQVFLRRSRELVQRTTDFVLFDELEAKATELGYSFAEGDEDRPLETKERETLLKLIYHLAKHAQLGESIPPWDPGANRTTFTRALADLTRLDPGTVRLHLSRARALFTTPGPTGDS